MYMISVLLVAALLPFQAVGITFYCTPNDDGTLTMTIRELNSVSEQLEAIDLATSATDGCISVQRTVDAITVNELNITVNLGTHTQISPLLDTADCYVVATVGTPSTYAVTVVSQTTAGMSLLGDTINTGSCASDTAPLEADVTGGQSLSHTITASTITAVADSLTAALLDDQGAAVTSPVVVGDMIRLRVMYSPPSVTAGETAVGIHMKNLVLSGYSDFRTTFELITSNGCMDATASTTLSMTEGPKYSASDSDVPNNNYAYQTGLFEVPLLDGPSPKTLYVKFNYERDCLAVTDLYCADQQTYCTNNNLLRRRKRSADGMGGGVSIMEQSNDLARRKRSTTNPPVNGTLQFAVPITIYAENVQAGASTGAGGVQGVSAEECEVPKIYWIISIVLAAFLLGTMLLCVFLLLRLRREQNQTDKMAEKIGHHNPSF